MLGKQGLHKKRTQRLSFILLLVALLFALTVKLPFYVTQPGSAVELAPIVEVEQGSTLEEGSLMLTTVRMGPGTVASYLYALIFPYVDVIPKERVRNPHESDQQYSQRQLELMSSSQESAKIVAFRQAGHPVKVENHGAKVMMLIPGLPAENLFEIGDVITAVDQQEVATAEEVLALLKDKQVGDEVAFTFLRDEETKQGTIKLVQLKHMNEEGELVPSDPPRAGIGVYPVTDRTVKLPQTVTIDTNEIGGPSAGMMFSLEIYNQLTDEDITKGYRIAGTGTISETGEVGPIGGIDHKIVAADKEEADLFFAPDTGREPTNYEEAVKTAEDIGTDMKIIPIRTVEDAIDYLQQLEPK